MAKRLGEIGMEESDVFEVLLKIANELGSERDFGDK